MTKLENPLTSGPVLGALFNPDKLTPETKAYLEAQDLASAYRQDPSATIISLRKGLSAGSTSQHRVALIELCSDQGNRLAKREPQQAVGYHLAAAELAFQAAGSSQESERRNGFRAAYNHSTGQVARILFDSGHAWDQTAMLEGPGKTYRLRSRIKGAKLVDPRLFDQLDPADYLEFHGIELERIRREGMGSAMVAFREGTPERRKVNPLLPPIGMSLPVNATLDFSQGGSNVELSSPHRGSDIAMNPIGRLGSKLIKAPRMILQNVSARNVEGLTPLGQKVLAERPDSIQGLKPTNPGTKAILAQPVRKGVVMHSVIGRKKPEDPVKDSSDGVVPYWSAHLDEAASEKVVHATHTTINANQDAIEEVGRILYLHAGIPYKR